MKKIIKTAVVSAVMSAAIFCGCGKEVAGEDLINAARDSYRALDSAYVEVVNDDTKEAEQTFTFKYDEKDILTYYYYGTDGENTIARFYNGYEEYTEQNGTVIGLFKTASRLPRLRRAGVPVPHPRLGQSSRPSKPAPAERPERRRAFSRPSRSSWAESG